ncbi:Transcriptional regulator AsnC family [Patulibacter medicamentivorans]|uniref:Transcriptional regulator AsnC family n=1 Tax=Patulibacter medicamentivorans TaxID=1097667 RepID=H0E8S4_9ACTN|nr:Lrp/AsnC family transcriptional regulator [Patulibacter medicamentivorans]EHN09952.1 Transcriptional regulator AsnC family [Patulibacter medicamentivorans]
MSRRAALDETDRAIVLALQRDGRMPFSRLGPEVGLSEAAVRQRVARLRESGVMQVVAVTEPLELGGRMMAMVGVRTSGDPRLVSEALAGLDEAIYVVETSGSFDLLVELVCEDQAHLLEVLSAKVRTIDGVVGTESFVYLGVRKHAFSYGVGRPRGG